MQQGHLDSALTAKGIEQARLVAAALRDERFDAMYASDLGRALQTARIIAEAVGIETRSAPELRERHLGILQGITFKQFERDHPEVVREYRKRGPAYKLPGGESSKERYDRHVAFARRLAAEHPGERVLVVAHGGTLDSLIRWVLHIPLDLPRRHSLFNSALNRFAVVDGEWRLITWGAIGHLGDIDVMDDH